MVKALLCAVSLAALVGAAPAMAEPAAAASSAAAKSPKLGTWGVDLAGRDAKAKPGDDFYRFVNGVWHDTTEIPADKSGYGAFYQLDDVSQVQARAILEEAAAGKVPDKDAGKIGAAYRAFMDEARIEALDAKPLAPMLARIKAQKSHEDVARMMGEPGFSASLFGSGVSDDAKNPEVYALYIRQAGLGLPDRDYYLAPAFAAQKAAYQAYVEQLLSMAGWPDAKAAAEKVVALETRIAEASWTRAERRDRDKTYNLTKVSDLPTLAPGFPWAAHLAAGGLTKANTVIVGENTAFPKLAKIFAETPVETWQAWQAFRSTEAAAPYLSKRFVDARFNFRGKTLSGQPEIQPRWKRAVAFTDSAVGESVGRIYVARHFPADSKAKMDELVLNVKAAMQARIEGLSWMSAPTKARALEKLDKFGLKIGYPEEWRDYSGLEMKPDDLFGNVQRSIAFEWARDVKRLGGPVDEREWLMTPQTVNAYYMPPKNEIVFPAAILQAPFFDPNADPAVNYGAIAGVIGHEITHGFDDQGRKSDGDGVQRDWWTPEDAAKFKVQADKLGAQYAAIEVLPGAKIDPGVTMGENIADLGGILLALDAYKLSLKGRPAPVIDGFTGEQRVFLGWGQAWRTKARETALRQQLVTDSHSPGEVRAYAPLRNVDAWYTAFNVKAGDKLYIAPADRVRIW